MQADCFQTLDVSRLSDALATLHEVVGCGKGRIEVTRPGCDDVCVLISKSELDSLERALQIFAGTTEFREMSQQIAQIVASTGGPQAQSDLSIEQ